MKVGKLKKSIGDTSRIVRYMWYAFGGIVVLVVAAFAMIAWGIYAADRGYGKSER